VSGFPPEGCCVVHQENRFIKFRLFNDWLESVLINDVITERERGEWEGPAFAFFDEFSRHVTGTLKENGLFHGIELLVIPAHTSNQMQTLNLRIFAIHKLELGCVHPHLGLDDQTSKLIKMLCGFQKAPIGTSIIDAFRKAEIMSRWDKGH
jgi:hypothetical protein